MENAGTLAAKIKLDFTVTDGGLMDALWFDFVQVKDGAIVGEFTRKPMSELETIAEGFELPLLKGENVQFILVYGMNEGASNTYMEKTFIADVAIAAAQYTEEKDGFGNNQYDKGAAWPLTNDEDAVEAGKTAKVNGVYYDTVNDAIAAAEPGAQIYLLCDTTAAVKVPAGAEIHLDLGGNTLTTTGSALVNDGKILSLSGGSIVSEAGYGVVNRGTIGVMNVNVQSEKVDAIVNGSKTVAAVIEEIAGGSYQGHADTYGSQTVGSFGLYNYTTSTVKLISGGTFQGSSTALRNYGTIESVTGGRFECPYMDGNNKTFCDNTTVGNVYYNNAPLSVTGGVWYNGQAKGPRLADGYRWEQGEICTMTSGKRYIRYDEETKTPAHWEDDPAGANYYYFTVVPKA